MYINHITFLGIIWPLAAPSPIIQWISYFIQFIDWLRYSCLLSRGIGRYGGYFAIFGGSFEDFRDNFVLQGAFFQFLAPHKSPGPDFLKEYIIWSDKCWLLTPKPHLDFITTNPWKASRSPQGVSQLEYLDWCCALDFSFHFDLHLCRFSSQNNSSFPPCLGCWSEWRTRPLPAWSSCLHEWCCTCWPPLFQFHR